jgi:predicted ATP-binding protein involved in virulence
MFFFLFEEESINKQLIEKIKAFSESIESNDFEFEEYKNRVDIVYKKYGVCSLKIEKLSDTKISIQIMKIQNPKYIAIQKKTHFNRYWKENIPQKEFIISIDNDGELQKLFYLIKGIKDTFISNIVVDFEVENIWFKDYRGFKDEKIEFNNKLTVLIGKNGSGKTSILEGIAVGIGAFLNGIDDVTDSKNINKEDIRFSIEDTEEMPVRYDFPPTIVNLKTKFIGQSIEWSRTKASLEGGRTSTKDSNVITTVVRQLVDDIRSNEDEFKRNIILPVFSYHGVGRVANFTRDMRMLEKTEKISRFVGYKDCLKAASNYKFFVNWYRKMKFREFEFQKNIPVLDSVTDSIKKTLISLTEDEEYRVKDIKYFEGEIGVLFEDGKIVPVSYLSDGYKDIIGIISDIAYRMAILNPKLGHDVLVQTPGIVLIDEIEVHLHPKWQQKILHILKNIFPKVQFIITTHSPIVISSTEKNEALELYKTDTGIKYEIVGNPKEWYISDILRNVFNIKEKIYEAPTGKTVEDNMEIFSDMVKEYLITKNENLRKQIENLYSDIIPSIPEDSPRRRVIERLNGLLK